MFKEQTRALAIVQKALVKSVVHGIIDKLKGQPDIKILTKGTLADLEKDNSWPVDWNFTLDDVISYKGLSLDLDICFNAVNYYGNEPINIEEEADVHGFGHTVKLHFPLVKVPKQLTHKRYDYDNRTWVTEKYWQDSNTTLSAQSDISVEDLYEKLVLAYREYKLRMAESDVLNVKKENAINKEAKKKKAKNVKAK